MLVIQEVLISAGFKQALIRINRWDRYKCCRKESVGLAQRWTRA